MHSYSLEHVVVRPVFHLYAASSKVFKFIIQGVLEFLYFMLKEISDTFLPPSHQMSVITIIVHCSTFLRPPLLLLIIIIIIIIVKPFFFLLLLLLHCMSMGEVTSRQRHQHLMMWEV